MSVNFVPKPAPTAIHKHTPSDYTHCLSRICRWWERIPFGYIGETEAIQRVNDFHHAFVSPDTCQELKFLAKSASRPKDD